jgi:hypothetical protein
MCREPSLFKTLLQLPAFRELDDINLTEEEERQIELEAKELLLNYFLNLPAFKELEE